MDGFTRPFANVHDYMTSHGKIQIQDSIPPDDDPSRPIILCLHGNSFCTYIWRHIFQSYLNQTHRLIAVDYPGHGCSSDALIPELSYNMPGYADGVLQVLQQLDVRRKLIVIGWSLGGHVAIEMAMRCDRIIGLVITGTPPVDTPEEIDKAFTFGPGGWKEAFAARAKLTEDELQAFAHNCADAPYEPWMEACVKRTDGRARELMFKHFAEGKPDPEGLRYARIYGIDRKWGQKECVETLPIPIAVINGRQEPFINLEWIRNIKFKNIWGNACIEMDGCLHAPFWGKPHDYQALLEDFIKDVSSQ